MYYIHVTLRKMLLKKQKYRRSYLRHVGLRHRFSQKEANPALAIS